MMTRTEWAWIGGILGVAAILYALDRLGLWLERKGWLYYRKSKATGTAMGANVFMEMQRLIEPSIVHVQELKQEQGEERHADDPFDRNEAKDVDS